MFFVLFRAVVASFTKYISVLVVHQISHLPLGVDLCQLITPVFVECGVEVLHQMKSIPDKRCVGAILFYACPVALVLICSNDFDQRAGLWTNDIKKLIQCFYSSIHIGSYPVNGTNKSINAATNHSHF